MKIVILEGSPNKNGSSNMLAEQFRRGAEEENLHVNIFSDMLEYAQIFVE